MVNTVGSADKTARAWTSDDAVSVATYRGHNAAVVCLAACSKLHELYTGCSDGSARSWDVETGQLLRVFVGHLAAVNCLQVCLLICLHHS